jgi:endonuclease/exonuclease/phosphatase family metal-dependent hydrolase
VSVAPPLRVMSWNLWWRFGDWQHRQEEILRVLEHTTPDIVGLQEVWATATENQAQALGDKLRMHVAWGPSPSPESYQRRLGDRRVVIGNAVLSRWPITRKSTRELPGGTVDVGRTALCAHIAGPAGAVPFFTVQLTSAIGHSALRSDQVRALAEFVVGECSEHASPIVTGDFNAEPDSDEMRLLCGLKTPPALPGLVLLDAWYFAEPASRGWTWDRRNPAVLATGEPGARIDYVFLGFRPTNESAPTVRAAWLTGNEPSGGVWPSDHAAVVVDFDVQGSIQSP